MTVSTTPERPYREIGDALTEYLGGSLAFTKFNATVVDAINAQSLDQDLLRRLHHVVSHYEADADLRAEDAHYAVSMADKLSVIAASLTYGTPEEVARSIDHFWRR
jgi:hypothetical protein